MSRRSRLAAAAIGATFALVAAGCSSAASGAPTASGASSCKKTKSPVLTLAAYSNVYDAYGKLTASSGTFATNWKAQHHQSVIFSMSFGGSTTQAENIVNGFPADVYASSLDPDVALVQKAGLITHNWLADPDQSVVATSVVGFMVRPGNPKHIHNWNDLTQPGLKILTPDPAQSGGAK